MPSQLSYTSASWSRWTLDDFRHNVLGKYVAVETPATPEEKKYYGTDWVGGCGLVVAVDKLGDLFMVDVDYGYRFIVYADTIVSVCTSSDHDELHAYGTCPVGVRGTSPGQEQHA